MRDILIGLNRGETCCRTSLTRTLKGNSLSFHANSVGRVMNKSVKYKKIDVRAPCSAELWESLTLIVRSALTAIKTFFQRFF